MEELKAVSNVIELKPDKQYLIICDVTRVKLEVIKALSNRLKDKVIHNLIVAVEDADGIKVIEADKPTVTMKEIEDAYSKVTDDNDKGTFVVSKKIGDLIKKIKETMTNKEGGKL